MITLPDWAAALARATLVHVDTYVDIRQAAALLGVSTAGVRYLREKGQLTGHKNSIGQLRFKESQVRALRKQRDTFNPERQAS